MFVVIQWFSCYNKIMTTDKFVYLFGKLIPALSLILSMALRFVPSFLGQLKFIRNGQKAMGKDISEGKLLDRIHAGLNMLSILITWALENAIETSDSMRSRGYGLKGRTAFSIYKFTKKDKSLLAVMAALFLVFATGCMNGASYASYDPRILLAGFTIQGHQAPVSVPVVEAMLTYICFACFCFLPVILDVTEKEQRERLRREFTANVSHELKTPLTSILGTAEILQNGLVKPEDVPHFAGNIHRETERLIGLVNDIIKLSRLDEGGGLGQWETVDLYEEARAVLEQLAPAAQRKQVTTRLQGGEALVRGVPQIVEEIVYNLCDNAIAYNRANGSVTVTVENTAFGPRITVADTGIGIPREAQGRVFERFYRVDKSHSSGGTGLGLSIVKHGAAYLGAQVELHSEPGHGSTFTLTFPKAGA